MKNELERFLEVWERDAAKTLALLESLPEDSYDFRPDPDGRSIGELAWHLAEAEAYGSFGIEQGGFAQGTRPPGLERPRTIAELKPGFERIHGDAVARVRNLSDADLDRKVTFFTGDPWAIRHLLWEFMLLHNVHHRGQLSMMCRQAGGHPASLFGPTRETMPLRKA
ncbi:MAG TPA: DinB family protein [Thermoanaerobaculia bacterium]|nr:DinB family protein [Thermoanaerobaculia bacterium]